MATIIESLVVELGLDPKQFTAGQREAVDSAKKAEDQLLRSGKAIEGSAKSMSSFFAELRGQVIALYAVFTAGKGIREFISDTVTGTAALGRFARTIDVSAQELATWRGAGAQMGGSADDMASSLYSLTQSMQQFQLTGESSVIPYLRALGIGLNDGNGHLKTSTQLFLDASAAVQRMDPARATAILSGLGANQSMINFLLQGPAAVRAQLAAQKNFAPSPEDIRAAQDFQKAWNQIGQESQRTGQIILTTLAPTILSVLKNIRDFVDFLRTHRTAAMAFFTGLTAVVGLLSVALAVNFVTAVGTAIAGGFGVLASVIGALTTTAIPGMLLGLATLTETALPALSAAFLAVGAAIEATPIGWIITGIAAIGVAGYELYEHWEAIKKWWHHLWGGMADDTETAKTRIQRTDDYFAGRRSGSSGGSPSGLLDMLDKAGVINSGSPGGGSAQAWQAARDAEAKYGIPAKVSYAQWALESDYGRRMPAGSNNPFGIKAATGQASVTAWTTEVVNGVATRVQANFAKYASLTDAFEAHARLLATRPQYAGARAHEDDPAAFADALTGIYATDPRYGAKLKAIMSRAGSGSGALALASNGGSITNHRAVHHETHIGKIEVVTRNPGDAKAVAGDIGRAIHDNTFAEQANYGAV